MKVINQGYEILTEIDGMELKRIEAAARTCYKSEEKMKEGSDLKMVRSLIKSGHEAMLEHSYLSVKFICDRGVSHEMVRHRLASYAMESTRYCRYDNGITCIRPVNLYDKEYDIWEDAMLACERYYISLVESGVSPQIARGVLPNSIKTELVMSANYREWRNFFKLRALGRNGKPHPQLQALADSLLHDLRKRIPVIFEDLIPFNHPKRY